MPPEFQLPNRARGRGQLVRIALLGKAEFAIDQKAHVTGCLFESCRTASSEAVKAAISVLQKFADAAAQMGGRLKDFAVAAIAKSAAAEPADAGKRVLPAAPR